ncbi:MAG: 50S ribosomal protein L25 [Microgenomates group bacterium]
MSSHTLQGEIRTIKGKQVKSVRANGQTPATVYGKGVEPETISVSAADFKKVYHEAGETGLIELTITGKKHPVLIHTVQVHPITAAILHVEFHEVNLKEKVHAEVPVELIGEPMAIKEKIGVLMPLMDHIEVEALPAELPEKIEVDITGLAAVNDQIIVGELTIPTGVEVLTDPTLIVVKIGAFIVEKEPEPVVTENAAEGEEKPAEETKEGEAAPAEETKEE